MEHAIGWTTDTMLWFVGICWRPGWLWLRQLANSFLMSHVNVGFTRKNVVHFFSRQKSINEFSGKFHVNFLLSSADGEVSSVQMIHESVRYIPFLVTAWHDENGCVRLTSTCLRALVENVSYALWFYASMDIDISIIHKSKIFPFISPIFTFPHSSVGRSIVWSFS